MVISLTKGLFQLFQLNNGVQWTYTQDPTPHLPAYSQQGRVPIAFHTMVFFTCICPWIGGISPRMLYLTHDQTTDVLSFMSQCDPLLGRPTVSAGKSCACAVSHGRAYRCRENIGDWSFCDCQPCPHERRRREATVGLGVDRSAGDILSLLPSVGRQQRNIEIWSLKTILMLNMPTYLIQFMSCRLCRDDRCGVAQAIATARDEFIKRMGN